MEIPLPDHSAPRSAEPEPAPLPGPAERIRALEAMLFVSPTPLRVSELAEATGWGRALIERDLEQLADSMEGRAIEVQRVAGAVRLVTVPEVAGYVERLMGVQTRRRLSRAQLETLAVVAYRQPVTRAQVEAQRGVGCDRVLGQLSDLRLIREVGRAELPGRPLLYATTPDFLRYFGIDSLDQLPDLTQVRPKSQVSASQAEFNAAARGEQPVADEPEAELGEGDEAKAPRKFHTMQPLAEELSSTPTGHLKKLLDKIRKKTETG